REERKATGLTDVCARTAAEAWRESIGIEPTHRPSRSGTAPRPSLDAPGYPRPMEPRRARAELVRSLQLAYSGELGAVRAYLGHRAALPHGDDRESVRRVLEDEVR